jgi:fructose-1-phosphate kinase PfkB-like protein
MISKVRRVDYSKKTVKAKSDSTVLEILPQKEENESSAKTVLIKHDYYSSDSDHGRDLLRALLRALYKSQINKLVIYLIDSGTLLLDKENVLFKTFQPLIAKSEMVIVADESLLFYGIDADIDSNILTQPLDSIAYDIINLPDILILE